MSPLVTGLVPARDRAKHILAPLLRGLIQQIKCPHPIRILILQLLPLLLQQDIRLGDIPKHKRDFGLVVRVLENSTCELVHGRDACAAGQESDVVVLVGRPGVFGNRAFHVQGVAGLHVVQVLGHGTAGVLFHDEGHVPTLVWVGLVLVREAEMGVRRV